MKRSADASKETAPVRRRRVALVLAGALAAALLAVPVTGAHGATVTKLADTDGACTPADCSLREAIGTGDSSIDFAPGLAGQIDLQSELPHLSHDVEIQGPAAKTLTVRGGGGRIFTVRSGVSEISGLTIENGSSIDNCPLADYGEPCPLDRDFGDGGGIFNAEGATLTIRNSVVSGNYAHGGRFGGGGGGIANGGTLTIVDSTVSGNQASGGAGISNFGVLTILNGTVSRNRVDPPDGPAGGIDNGGTMTIVNSTVSENRAEAQGGIRSLGGTLTVIASTIANNRVQSSGANLLVGFGGTATLRSTILGAPRSDAENCAVGFPYGSGTLISQGYNLADDRSCNLTQATDQPDTDPGLGPLGDNGGPTHTMALLPTSPAIDRGISGSLATDQRGEPRPIDFPSVPNAPGGDGADVGAFERQLLASNRFQFRALIRNRRLGTAGQRIWVASSGRLVLHRNKRVRRFARQVEGRDVVAVRVRPRGNAKRRLARAGEERRRVAVQVRARVTLNPKGGPPRTKARHLWLVRVGDR
jgi:CSLREA domain-containing protein